MCFIVFTSCVFIQAFELSINEHCNNICNLFSFNSIFQAPPQSACYVMEGLSCLSQFQSALSSLFDSSTPTSSYTSYCRYTLSFITFQHADQQLYIVLQMLLQYCKWTLSTTLPIVWCSDDALMKLHTVNLIRNELLRASTLFSFPFTQGWVGKSTPWPR